MKKNANYSFKYPNTVEHQKVVPGHYAFLIACQNYEKDVPLDNPINDAQALADLLSDKYGFKVDTLFDPNKKQLKDYIDSIDGKIKHKNSKVVIFYAGHSFITETEEGLKGYLAPVDGDSKEEDSCIPVNYLTEKVMDLNKEDSRHVLVLLDSCHGAVVSTVFYKNRGFGRESMNRISKQRYNIYENNISCQILVASAVRQKAKDGFKAKNGVVHSPFTYFILEGLEGEADSDRNKIIGADEIYVYLRKKMAMAYTGKDNTQRVGLIPMYPRHDNGEFLFKMDGFNENDLETQEFTNPYKGLNAYTEADESLFFGREQEIKRLVLAIINDNIPILIVKGPSGSGKSSIVKAGAIPILKAKHAKNIITIKPGEEKPDTNGYDIVFIDQYESLFDPKNKPHYRKAFNSFIIEQVNAGKKVVLTLRDDFEYAAKNEELKDYWLEKNHFFELKDFTFEQIQDIVKAPTIRFGYDLHHAVADDIASEVFSNRHALPMLSFMMYELCELCKDMPGGYWRIGWEEYKKIGKVQGALQKKADTVLEEIGGEKHQKIMRSILLRMVTFNLGNILKRAVYESDLNIKGYQSKEDQEITQTIINKLIENRLVMTTKDHQGKNYFEPSHEALIDSWPEMRNWLQTVRPEGIMFSNELNNNAHTYYSRKERSRDLLSGTKLTEAIRYRNDENKLILLSIAEDEFIQRSLKKRHRENFNLAVLLFVVFALIFGATYNWYTVDQAGKQNAKRTWGYQINSSIAALNVEISNMNEKVYNAKKLRVQENYDGELVQLDEIEKSMVSSESSLTARFDVLLNDKKVTERDSFRNKLVHGKAKIGAILEEIRCERDSCIEYKKMWEKYSTIKVAADLLRSQGNEKLLAAFRKYQQARAVGYPPKSEEIKAIVRETGENLKSVYNLFIGFGDARAKAKNYKAALEAYKYAQDIAIALGISTIEVDKKINKIKNKS